MIKSILLFLFVIIFNSCQSFRCEKNVVNYKVCEGKELIENNTNKKKFKKYISNIYCNSLIIKNKSLNIEVYFEPLIINSKHEGLYYFRVFYKIAKIPLYKNHKVRFALVSMINGKMNFLSENDENSNIEIYNLLLNKFNPEQVKEYEEDIKSGYIFIDQ